MSDKVKKAAEEYLSQKRTEGRPAYEEADESFFEKSVQALTTPFRWGAEGLTSLFLRAQDSTLSQEQAYALAQGNRAGKEWYESGDKPVTLGQSFYGAVSGQDIDWTNSKQVQDYFSKDSQKFISGGIDAVASLALDPLNYVGVGLGAKGLAALGLMPWAGKLKALPEVADLTRLESLSAKNFSSVTDYFKYTQEQFLASPLQQNALRVGTQAYKDEVLRLQPYFKGIDEFEDFYGVKISPLSDTASYLFDGVKVRAVDGEKFYSYNIESKDWGVEPALSPQVAETARAQFSVSGFTDLNDVAVKGFESVKDYAKVKRIKTWDDKDLPAGVKFGVWRFTDDTEQYIAYNSADGSYWALSDKPIAERYFADTSNVVENVADYDAALYDVLDYQFKNNQFLSARDFYNENPALFNIKNFDEGAQRKYFTIEDKVYTKNRKGNFLVWNSDNSSWDEIFKPKVKDSNKQLELETRLSEKQDKYIREGDDEFDDEIFEDSTRQDFYEQLDFTDEYLDEATGEFTTDWVPEGMQVDETPLDLPEIGGVAEKRWYPMDKSNIEEYGLAYSLRYRDQFGDLRQAWIPANLQVISRNSEAAADAANSLAFPTAPILRTQDKKVYTLGLDGNITTLEDAHRQNELYGNFILEEQTRRAKLIASKNNLGKPLNTVSKEKQAEDAAKLVDENARINAIRKMEYEEVSARLELMEKPTKKERDIFDEVSSIVNDTSRTKAVDELVTPEQKDIFNRIREYDALQQQKMQLARTKEEALALEEQVKFDVRDAEIEDKLLSDPEYKVAAYEWFAQGKSGQRPITISFWYDSKLNENGTYTITQMGRRTDFSGFGDDSQALASKEWEIFKWENISVDDLKKISYTSKEKYPSGFVNPTSKQPLEKFPDRTLWDLISDPDMPAVTINVDELDTFGRQISGKDTIKPFMGNPKMKGVVTASKRLTPRRYLTWEQARKKVYGTDTEPGVLDGLIKRKANAVAQIEKGNNAYKPTLDFLNKELEYYRTYYLTEETYQNGILEGMVRRETGPSKPEIWFLNLEDALNRIAGTSHDINAATVGFMDRDLARITPLTRQEQLAEEAMAKAAKSKRKTKFPIERELVSEDVAAKPLDIDSVIGPTPEDIKAIGAKAERTAKLKAGTLKEEPVPTAIDKVTDVAPATDVVIHSGGAKGADTVFAEIGSELGLPTKAHSFEGHRIENLDARPSQEEIVVHSQDELNTADEVMSAVNKNYLYRTYPTKDLNRTNLLRRNYFQVKDSEAIIAVTHINDKGIVEGGTAWAIYAGVEMNKPVHVFDYLRGNWYTWQDGKFVRSELPPKYNSFAGIGSRKVENSDAGKQAIRDYLSQFKKAGTLKEEPTPMTTDKIDLFRGENSFLSNMSDSPITINGESYPTVEHAFQAAKFSDPAKRKAIAEAKTAADAKRLGKQSGMRSDWNERRVQIMEDILRAKFDQNAELKQKLIDTGDTELIEGNTWGDKFWGQVDGNGENNLGKLLMKIRDEYRKAE